MKRYLGIASFLCLFVVSETLTADVVMPALFSDNMVLQRGKKISVWGKADMGEKVTVSIQGNSGSAKADFDGRWMVKLNPMKAGGPFTLKIKGTNTIMIKNVLIGEVWICSGQSNMEMPLRGWGKMYVEGSKKAIDSANFPNMRLFTVQKKTSPVPLDDCVGKWSECRPETADPFSATGFFFGRKLLKELKIPIGLIHTSWGGTPGEAWTTARRISQIGSFGDTVRDLRKIGRNYDKAVKSYEKKLKKWNNDLFAKTTGEDFEKCNAPDFDDSSWLEIDVPKKWSATKLGNFEGSASFRKKIEIPGEWKGTNLILELGPVDDMDITFFNGKKIGETNNWAVNRIYKIPAGIVQTGTSVLVVTVINPNGEGGIYGTSGQLKIYPEGKRQKAISLAGKWRCKKGIAVNALPKQPTNPAGINAHTPTSLYNGMINPLVPFSIRGAIWYQGESNTYDPKLYRAIFPALIKSWRDVFMQGNFPFYYVQIAPFRYGGNDNRGVKIREVQRETLSKVGKVGMAVLMDKTTLDNIHPPYKQETGERLALWALAKDYGKKIVFSGPLYKGIEVVGNKVKVAFHQKGSGLTSHGKPLTGFEVAGADKIFYPAKAVIEGDVVVVSCDKVKKPVAVQYGWSDIATATLFNKEGLPASSFRSCEW